LNILVVCPKFEYGEEHRGYSYDYRNFFLPLTSTENTVEFFDFFSEFKVYGKKKMNERILKFIKEKNFNFVIFSLHKDEFETEMLNNIRKYTRTICLFHDDTWRKDFTNYWSDFFDYHTTTDIYSLETNIKNNKIYFPYGCNENIYKKILNEKKIYDISFVGSWHPHREWVIKKLKKKNFNVKAFGFGWPEGPVSHENMIKIFNQTKINLNLSNTISWDLRYLLSTPRGIVNSIRSKKNAEQLKGRVFEINGCGAFQLTNYVDGLELFYKLREEIGIFNDINDLINKVFFYLEREYLIEQISERAFHRTLKDHTYKQRFNDLFKKIDAIN
jgi:spore maturation protein CgeB